MRCTYALLFLIDGILCVDRGWRAGGGVCISLSFFRFIDGNEWATMMMRRRLGERVCVRARNIEGVRNQRERGH